HRDDFGVVRLLPSGQFDPGFGVDGVATIDFAGGFDAATWVGVDSRGRIVVAGVAAEDSPDFGIARLMPTGKLDRAFGDDGTVFPPIGKDTRFFEERATDAAFLPDGRLTVVGPFETYGTAVSRYEMSGAGPRDRDADGTPDSRDQCVSIHGPKSGCP